MLWIRKRRQLTVWKLFQRVRKIIHESTNTRESIFAIESVRCDKQLEWLTKMLVSFYYIIITRIISQQTYKHIYYYMPTCILKGWNTNWSCLIVWAVYNIQGERTTHCSFRDLTFSGWFRHVSQGNSEHSHWMQQ